MRARERKGEACLLTLQLLELDISEPQLAALREAADSREAAISRGAAEVLDARRGKWRIPVHNLQAESGGL